MDTNVLDGTLTRTQVVQVIMHIRHEWEDAARGDSLLEINGCVGLILADIAKGLGLYGIDLQLALGELADELKDA